MFENVIYYLIFSGILGIILFELSWAKTYKLRKGNPELDKEHPSAVRGDHPIQKWKFYFGAVFLLVNRALGYFMITAIAISATYAFEVDIL